MDIELGDEVKHTVSGFKGIAVAITTWLHGCRRVNVQPKSTDSGAKLPDALAFDELELEVTKKAVVPSTPARSPEKAQPAERKSATGGPRPLAGKY